jgi:hypothetical protein
LTTGEGLNYHPIDISSTITVHIKKSVEDDIVQKPDIETPNTKTGKQRHGCLTAWLILIIAFSVIFVVVYLTGVGVNESSKNMPEWAIPVLIILLIFNIVCAVALFRWKKWGFWGFCAVNVIGIIVDILIGISIVWPSIDVLVSLAILYGVLHIGGENKGWPQLD